MSDENEKDPITVDERIETVFGGKDIEKTVPELIEELTDLNAKHMQQKWDSVKVKLIHSGSSDGLALELFGTRRESQDETDARVERQAQEDKFVFKQKWEQFKELKAFFKENKDKIKENI